MSNSDNNNPSLESSTAVEIPSVEQQLQAMEILEANRLLLKTTLGKGIETSEIAREFLKVANEFLDKELYDTILNKTLKNLQQSEGIMDSKNSNSPSI